MKRLFALLLLIPGIAWAGANATNSTTIGFANNTTNFHADVLSVSGLSGAGLTAVPAGNLTGALNISLVTSGTLPWSYITGAPTYTNESTTVANTSTINLTLSAGQITGVFNNSAGYLTTINGLSGAGLTAIPAGNLSGAFNISLVTSGTLPWGYITGSPAYITTINGLSGAGLTSIPSANLSSGINLNLVTSGTIPASMVSGIASSSYVSFTNNETSNINWAHTFNATQLQVNGVNVSTSAGTVYDGNATNITSGTLNATRLPATALLTTSNLNASLINAGTIPAANLGVIPVVNLATTVLTTTSNLNASLINAGSIPAANLGLVAVANGGTGSTTGSGAALISLNATNITAGTIPAAQLGVIAAANGGTGSGTGSAAALNNIPAANITGLYTTTWPVMRLNILSTTAGTIPGSTLSIQKNYTIQKVYAQNIGGTNCIINLREVDSTGTTPLYTMMSGQTVTSTLLTVTSFTGGTCPAKNLLVWDVMSVSGTISSTRLEVHGTEY